MRASTPVLRAACLCAASALVAPGARALELGFEARALVQSSDNIGFDDAGDEEDALLGFGSVGVYGERRGQRVSGAFQGEIDARRRLDDDDDEWDALSRFFGAAEFRLTPRALRWYAGNVLGGVLDDTLQPVDGFETRRRNVFVTGPSLEAPFGAFARLDARLLYVNQTEEGDELETLYTGFARYTRERVRGRSWGLVGSNVYADAPSDGPAGGPGDGDELDFNRSSLAVFAARERTPWSLYGELGGTAYVTDDESVTGLAAQATVARALGPDSTLSLTVSTDLNDQTLGTVESLIAEGIGERQDADGVYTETRATLAYTLDDTRASVEAGVGVSDIDYSLVADGGGFSTDASSQDQVQGIAYAVLARSLTPSVRGSLGIDYRREVFDDAPDELDSTLASARLIWAFARSFELEASYILDRATGTESLADGDGIFEGSIDRTENRFGLGLRWAPPSRAGRDLVIELKSLIR